ncbi:MAG: HEPN domain-containing protein [bacterium]
MRKDESLYPEDWFKMGAKELKRAENLLEFDDLEGAGFNIQQAIEKYLKGYLLSKGWKLRRIHELETLLNEVVGYEPSFEEFRQECLKITDYYIEERYPFTVTSELTEEEVRISLQAAKKMIDKILRLVRAKSNDDQEEK